MKTGAPGTDGAFWRGRRVLVTGHTGFKGSWLCLWLQAMGAETAGYALAPPAGPALFSEAGTGRDMRSTIADIRDAAAVRAAVRDFRPDIIFHMAAQPLVRLSYREPAETYATNVMGTVHILEAARAADSVAAVVNVTTDKCYENRERAAGYREDEPMGGHDPYSSSKGCAELVTAAWRRSFCADGPALATARAGNVFGGGDWAADRLLPDIIRAFENGVPAPIRNPHAIRPWQYVLEPLSGYLRLGRKLLEDGTPWAEAWNFGPEDADARPVEWIADRMAARWGGNAAWTRDGGPHPHEAHFLRLDITKARQRLGWRPRWDIDTGIDRLIDWHRRRAAGENVRTLCMAQIDAFTRAAPDGQEP